MARAAAAKATGKVAKATRTPSKGSRRARGSLSREEILDGAQYLVEEYGLKQLSMPALICWAAAGWAKARASTMPAMA